jgi:uncharacterized glyoxalase superfamily protein PhnB
MSVGPDDTRDVQEDKEAAWMNPPAGYTIVAPYLLYEDATRAIAHLEQAYGFQLRASRTGGAGRLHAELLIGEDGLVMLGQAGPDFQSPRTRGVTPPSMVHVYVSDVDALHERARTAGADVSELEDTVAGDRRFTAVDPEGQMWVFAQRMG